MALDLRAPHMLEEIRSAEAEADGKLRVIRDMKERYSFWMNRQQYEEKENYFENAYFEYISLILPRLVWDNPRIRVTSRRPGRAEFIGQAMQHALNRWCRDVKIRQVLMPIFFDMLFGWGVGITTEEDRPGQGKNKTTRWPVHRRIDPNRFGMDPWALHHSEARFKYHVWVIDKDDLLEMAKEDKDGGWNGEVIDNLSTGVGLDKLYRAGESYEQTPDRKEITLYEIWVPEAQMDGFDEEDFFHGSILTMAVEQTQDGKDNANFVREQRAFYGPAKGPYTLYGVYPSAEGNYPLGPLMAAQSQIEDVNDHARAIKQDADDYARGIFVDETDPNLAKKLKDFDHSTVHTIKGFDKNRFAEVTKGGISQEQVAYLGIAKERLDRILGMSDAVKGNVTGEGTATENSIAAESSSIRLGFIKQQGQEAVISMLTGVAEYIHEDDEVEIMLGSEAAEDLGMEEPVLTGGRDDEDEHSFSDFEWEIEPYSMERTDQSVQARRAQMTVQVATELAPLVPQMPWLDWKRLFGILGDAANDPDLGKIVNVEMAMQFAGMQEGSVGPGPREAQPRYGKDLGTNRMGPRRLTGDRSAEGQAQKTLGRSAGRQAREMAK